MVALPDGRSGSQRSGGGRGTGSACSPPATTLLAMDVRDLRGTTRNAVRSGTQDNMARTLNLLSPWIPPTGDATPTSAALTTFRPTAGYQRSASPSLIARFAPVTGTHARYWSYRSTTSGARGSATSGSSLNSSRAALAQEVPALVKRHLQALQARTLSRLKAPMSAAEAILLSHQLADPSENLLIGHVLRPPARALMPPIIQVVVQGWRVILTQGLKQFTKRVRTATRSAQAVTQAGAGGNHCSRKGNT
jgi:hypothetical protein